MTETTYADVGGDENTGFAEEPAPVRPVRRPRPRNTKHRVRATTDIQAQGNPTNGLGKTLFESENEQEARNYIVQRHPRGNEVALELADGTVRH